MKKGGVDYLSSALYGINNFVNKISGSVKMYKLVELLNEYEEWKEEEYGRNNYKWKYKAQDDFLYAERVDGSILGEEESWAVIICRGYCFIKWLVENDKINRKKVNFWDSIIYCVYEYYPKISVEDELLMLLAIKDEPIRFLCEILK